MSDIDPECTATSDASRLLLQLFHSATTPK
jgi:hypothetical protein